MRIGKIVRTESSTNEHEFIEINGTKIFAGLTFTGLISGLVMFFTFVLISYPQNKNQIEFENDMNNFQYINFVLRNDNDTVRKKSFELLLKAGIIEESEKGMFDEFIEKNNLPNWSSYKKFIPLKASANVSVGGTINNSNSSNKSSDTNSNSNSSESQE